MVGRFIGEKEKWQGKKASCIKVRWTRPDTYTSPAYRGVSAIVDRHVGAFSSACPHLQTICIPLSLRREKFRKNGVTMPP